MTHGDYYPSPDECKPKRGLGLREVQRLKRQIPRIEGRIRRAQESRERAEIRAQIAWSDGERRRYERVAIRADRRLEKAQRDLEDTRSRLLASWEIPPVTAPEVRCDFGPLFTEGAHNG